MTKITAKIDVEIDEFREIYYLSKLYSDQYFDYCFVAILNCFTTKQIHFMYPEEYIKSMKKVDKISSRILTVVLNSARIMLSHNQNWIAKFITSSDHYCEGDVINLIKKLIKKERGYNPFEPTLPIAVSKQRRNNVKNKLITKHCFKIPCYKDLTLPDKIISHIPVDCDINYIILKPRYKVNKRGETNRVLTLTFLYTLPSDTVDSDGFIILKRRKI